MEYEKQDCIRNSENCRNTDSQGKNASRQSQSKNDCRSNAQNKGQSRAQNKSQNKASNKSASDYDCD